MPSFFLVTIKGECTVQWGVWTALLESKTATNLWTKRSCSQPRDTLLVRYILTQVHPPRNDSLPLRLILIYAPSSKDLLPLSTLTPPMQRLAPRTSRHTTLCPHRTFLPRRPIKARQQHVGALDVLAARRLSLADLVLPAAAAAAGSRARLSRAPPPDGRDPLLAGLAHEVGEPGREGGWVGVVGEEGGRGRGRSRKGCWVAVNRRGWRFDLGGGRRGWFGEGKGRRWARGRRARADRGSRLRVGYWRLGCDDA